MNQGSSKNNQPNNQPGSPENGEPAYISIGKIRRPHGVKGEMAMQVETDFPEKIRVGLQVFLGTKKQPYDITSVRSTSSGLLISFSTIHDPETAGLLRNQLVFITTSNKRDLPEGRYYHHEVIGMRVVDEQESVLGDVSEILLTGANDVYVIRNELGKELLIPAIKSVILDIDAAKKVMKVRLQEWD